MKTIRILLADDHQLIRESWEHLLGSEPGYRIVGHATDGGEAITAAQMMEPDIILMDINMQPMDGFEATKVISANSNIKIIGVSMHNATAYAKKFFGCGGRGYVTKNSAKEALFDAIKAVMAGKKFVCPEIRDKISDNEFSGKHKTPDASALTEREREVALFVQKGLSSKEIGETIGRSAKTVEAHRYNILRKLGLKNSASLVNFLSASL